MLHLKSSFCATRFAKLCLFILVAALTLGGFITEVKGETLACSTSPDSSTVQYSLWNSFLGIVNILELNNTDQCPAKLRIRFFQLDGTESDSLGFTLGSGEQKDIILNNLSGFVQDSYGIVQVDAKNLKIDGRVSYYRPSTQSENAFSGTSGERFDFVFSTPLTQGLSGTSSVVFNTHQPSLHPADQENLVANWLTLVNINRRLS